MRGVVIIAVGSPGYGQWAFNQALSIKRTTPGIRVQLLYEPETIQSIPTFPFDILTNVGEVCRKSHTGRFEPAELKLRLPEYSVFRETIYLDADGLTFRDLRSLFDLCEGKDFAGQVTGYVTQTQGKEAMLWATPDKLWERYNLPPGGKIPALNSSFLYFRKGQVASKIFENAYTNYLNNLPIEELDYKWGQSGAQPDELYLNLALAQLGIDPILTVTPIYFRTSVDTGTSRPLHELQEKHWGLGCWGDRAYNHISVRKYYDALMKRYCSEVGIPHNYQFERLIRRKFFRNPVKL